MRRGVWLHCAGLSCCDSAVASGSRAGREGKQRKCEAEKIEEKELEKSEVVNSVALPGGIEIPIPKPEILVAAGTTATVSVGATLFATSVFKKCVSAFKPAVKQIINRVQRKLGKKPVSWSRQRLAQRRRKLQNTVN